jgi:hypothetical protein
MIPQISTYPHAAVTTAIVTPKLNSTNLVDIVPVPRRQVNVREGQMLQGDLPRFFYYAGYRA